MSGARISQDSKSKVERSKEFHIVETIARLVFVVLGIHWCASHGIMGKSLAIQYIAVFAVIVLSLAAASAVTHLFARNSRC